MSRSKQYTSLLLWPIFKSPKLPQYLSDILRSCGDSAFLKSPWRPQCCSQDSPSVCFSVLLEPQCFQSQISSSWRRDKMYLQPLRRPHLLLRQLLPIARMALILEVAGTAPEQPTSPLPPTLKLRGLTLALLFP